eukprot:Amastigsp_a340147_131.p2 type:complete len:105 gc:universal Amastigsp_a340147_131:262-576(+)
MFTCVRRSVPELPLFFLPFSSSRWLSPRQCAPQRLRPGRQISRPSHLLRAAPWASWARFYRSSRSFSSRSEPREPTAFSECSAPCESTRPTSPSWTRTALMSSS